MDKTTARIIADALTWARILSAIPITLLAWFGLGNWVLGLYIAAALTDLADGAFARRATPAKTSTDFDGLADLLFSVMSLVWIWMLIPGFVARYWFPYLPLLLLIEAYLIAARVRYPDIRIPHFQFGRWAMALFCFLLPVLLVFGDLPGFVHVVLVIGTASKLQLAWYLATTEKPRRETGLAG